MYNNYIPVQNSEMVYTAWPTDQMCSMETSTTKECTICGAPSNGYHFNAPSCSACAAFFRRTVTLNRNFVCNQQSNCRVNYAMRVICRACRYTKCIKMGMDRSAVQPRRDCNAGRRKMLYHEMKPAIQQPQFDENQGFLQQQQPVEFEQFHRSPEVHYAQSYSSSISEEIPSPKHSFLNLEKPTFLKDFEAEQLLEDLLREERVYNERRRILYCSDIALGQLLANENTNDIPYTSTNIRPLTFIEIQKHIRPQILVTYEWLRGWRHFQMLNTHDRLIFLRRCVLYQTIMDPSYLTYKLGYPNKFVMFNGMYVGIDENDQTGWENEENYISSELKTKLYRPLMRRVFNEICTPMHSIELTFVEFVILKALVSFKSAACADVSLPLRKCMNAHLNTILKALNFHYQSIGLPKDEIGQRTGNVVLMMSNIFAVGMECLESHQKIQFFDLWQLDDLLIKLIRPQSS